MDEEMIWRWNDVVRDGDTVYHLGDFTLGGISKFKHYVDQLNGKKIRILNNAKHHDKHWIKEFRAGDFGGRVELISQIYELRLFKDPKTNRWHSIILCHYPFASWEKSFHGSWHLYGHCHGMYEGRGLSLDVGVDRHGFYPISLEQLQEVFSKKKKSGI